jgi:hypothetical protein
VAPHNQPKFSSENVKTSPNVEGYKQNEWVIVCRLWSSTNFLVGIASRCIPPPDEPHVHD